MNFHLSTSKQDLGNLSAPPLDIFYWHRLVVDELHEPLRMLRDAAGLRQSGQVMSFKALTGDSRVLLPVRSVQRLRG